MAVDFINNEPSSGGSVSIAGGVKTAVLSTAFTGSVETALTTQIGADTTILDFERVEFTSAVTSGTLTVPAGAVVGQTLELIALAGFSVVTADLLVTITNADAIEVLLTIDAVGEGAKLEWNGSRWASLHNVNATTSLTA